MGDAQGVQHMPRGEVVAQGGQMHSVTIPVPRVSGLAQSPVVDEYGGARVDHLAKELVEDGHPSSECTKRARGSDSVSEEHDLGADLDCSSDGRIDRLDEPVDVHTQVEKIIARTLNRDEVWRQVQSRRELLIDDLGDGPPADGEVGVSRSPRSWLASVSATRSAQPRTPLGRLGSGSPTPSVQESPMATYRL